MKRLLSRLSAIPLALTLAGVCLTVQSQTRSYLGRSLTLVPPLGYCEMGKSEAELAIVAFLRKSTEYSGELAQYVVPCSELAEFRKGSRKTFTNWGQVLVLKNKGVLRLVPTSREELVRSIAGHMSGQPLDLKAEEARIKKSLSGSGVSVSGQSISPLGATKDAAFMELRGSAMVDGVEYPFTAVGAITVVNSLALGVYGYESPKAKLGSSVPLTEAYLQSVLNRN